MLRASMPQAPRQQASQAGTNMQYGFGFSLKARLMGSGSGGGGAAPLSVLRGYQPSTNNGTTGDKFVAATGGSNANSGTVGSPYATIAYAMTQISAGQHIKVRAGKYREAVSFSGKGGSVGTRTKISNYGTEQVIITAADAITGWTQCAAGDSTVLGSTLGVASSPVYKKTIAKSTIASGDPRAAFPFENGVKLNACMSRPANPFRADLEKDTRDWWTATTTVQSAGLITGYRYAPVTSLYTTAQIQSADVVFYGGANHSYRTKVASFGAGTDAVANTINLTDQTRAYNTGTPAADKFALVNILPALKAGEWGFTDDDATNCTIYIYPTSSANMAANIEISTRGSVIDFTQNTSHCEISGLIVERASSYGASADGNYAVTGGGVTKRSGLVVNNCWVRDTWRGEEDYAPIWIGNVDGVQIRQTTVENAYGQFGIMLQGSMWDTSGMADGSRIDRCLIINSENSPIRTFGQANGVCSWTTAYRSGLASHANKGNNYASCHRFLWWGCDFRGSSGYHTWQQASSIVEAFCDIPVSYNATDGRAIVDQNSSSVGAQSPATEQSINGDSYVLNTITEPYWPVIASTNAITFSETAETMVRYGAKNNILHGGDAVNQTLLITNGWRNNLLTSGSALAASAGTDQTATPAAVYNDAQFGDTSIKIGSPSLSATTASIAAEIAVLAGWFPDFASQMGYDLAGSAFTAATPPMGPYVNALAPNALPATWIERPTISGTPLVGGSLSLANGYRVGSPFPSLAYQWKKSLDLVTWSNVASAGSAATYTPISGDIGYYLGCFMTATNTGGVATTFPFSSSLVASSYPLGNPSLLVTAKQTSGGTSTTKQIETGTFAATNKPIMVVVSQRSATAADATMTVTIGSGARAFGTGTALTFKARTRRTSNETQVLFIAAPGTGTFTIQHESSLQTRGVQIQVFEVVGATDITAPTVQGGGSTALAASHTVTTDTANAGVLHILNRFSGDLAGNAVTMTGATVLTNDNTNGVSATDDLTIVLGYEQAAAIGTQTAASSWPTGVTEAHISVQIKS